MTTCFLCDEYDRWIKWAEDNGHNELAVFLTDRSDEHVNQAADASTWEGLSDLADDDASEGRAIGG